MTKSYVQPGDLFVIDRRAPIFETLLFLDVPMKWMFRQPGVRSVEKQTLALSITTSYLPSGLSREGAMIIFVLSSDFIGWVNNKWNIGKI